MIIAKDPQNRFISECCGAEPIVFIGAAGVSRFYACEKCQKPCVLKPKTLEIDVHDTIKLKDVPHQ